MDSLTNTDKKHKIQKKYTYKHSTLNKTKKKHKSCNCKNSKCLKLYCECFRKKGFCGASCNCIGCKNTEMFLDERQAAIDLIEEKNIMAFEPKIRKIIFKPPK